MFHNSLLGLFALCTLFGQLPSTSAGSHGSPTGAQLARRHARTTRLQPRSSKSDLKPRDQEAHHANLMGISPSALRLAGGLFLGFFPDDTKGAGGKQQTMADIIKSIDPSGHKKPALYGWYTQVSQGYPYDGMQLLWRLKDIKESGAVFVPTLMPKGGWGGLRKGDNSQAVRIAKVLKQITDQGVVVWLRAFHECNWYQRDHEYPGTAEDCLEGWDTMARAVKEFASEVKMFWCPNVAHDLKAVEYFNYKPRDFSTVDIVGIDYYPKSKEEATREKFLEVVMPFYTNFTKGDQPFVLGETGMHFNSDMATKLSWLDALASAKKDLPKFLAATWYNNKKEHDYEIAGEGVTTKALLEKFE